MLNVADSAPMFCFFHNYYNNDHLYNLVKLLCHKGLCPMVMPPVNSSTTRSSALQQHCHFQNHTRLWRHQHHKNSAPMVHGTAPHKTLIVTLPVPASCIMQVSAPRDSGWLFADKKKSSLRHEGGIKGGDSMCSTETYANHTHIKEPPPAYTPEEYETNHRPS